jgi:hypothetical protein
MSYRLLPALFVAFSPLLASCGGEENGGGGDASIGSIAPSSRYAQQCAPDNPYSADALATPSIGSLATEKQWIRSYFNEAYLWYDAVPAINAASSPYVGSLTSYDGNGVPMPLSNYFQALKTTAATASGSKVDKFSFAYPTAAWNALSQSGTEAGYGIEWMRYQSTTPRSWRVATVQPGSPAASAGIQRGDTLVSVDGVDFVTDRSTSGLNVLNEGLFPSSGAQHTFVLSRTGNGNLSYVLTASSSVAIDPVPLVTAFTRGANKIGYMVFTDHIVPSEQKLIDAVTTLKNAAITDLVLDLRYNGGGYLYIASEVAYMIAGANQVGGKVFDRTVYNAKRTAENNSTPFYSTACILGSNNRCTSSQPLPTLNLRRVFVLTQRDTCSASEAIINGLAGADVQVIQIGATTCGKPYGFTAQDNCGISYFPIEFKGVNNKGFGDYTDGFSPVQAGASGTNLLGCTATDDLEHALGDLSETMLHTVLYRIENGSCPSGVSIFAQDSGRGSAVGSLLLPEVRRNRIMLPAGRDR